MNQLRWYLYSKEKLQKEACLKRETEIVDYRLIDYIFFSIIWKFVICNIDDDWNIGHRRCPEKKFSLGGPTLKKNKKTLTPIISGLAKQNGLKFFRTFKHEKRFDNTFLLFDFMMEKVIWRDVNVWFTFCESHSSEL